MGSCCISSFFGSTLPTNTLFPRRPTFFLIAFCIFVIFVDHAAYTHDYIPLQLLVSNIMNLLGATTVIGICCRAALNENDASNHTKETFYPEVVYIEILVTPCGLHK